MSSLVLLLTTYVSLSLSSIYRSPKLIEATLVRLSNSSINRELSEDNIDSLGSKDSSDSNSRSSILMYLVFLLLRSSSLLNPL